MFSRPFDMLRASFLQIPEGEDHFAVPFGLFAALSFQMPGSESLKPA